MKKHTTFKIGGPADIFVKVKILYVNLVYLKMNVNIIKKMYKIN